MTVCRFDDAVHGRALELRGFVTTIRAETPDALPAALAGIERCRQAGCWIGFTLPYALGEWLEPALSTHDPLALTAARGAPRLTAHVFEQAVDAPLSTLAPDAGPARVVRARPRIGFEAYRDKIETIRRWITEGDVYQVNFTLPVDVEVAGHPASLYRTLLDRHPVSHAAYIDDGASYTLSFSPELFLSRSGGRLTSRPMKGTAPRHPDPDADQASAHALRHSPKDRAENAMIVDLLRNDLGRIARTGSVTVEKLFDLECYPSIWTLTSTIQADIGDTPFLDVLRALFPCGSVVGAPKIAAMRCIRALEPDDRGLYCGSIGWMAPNGDFSLNVAIRTLVLDRTGAGVYGVGGGIVFDSEAELEWRECQWKSRVLGDAHADGWA
jgi:para-aminobenzoate synthetase component I